MVLTEKRIPLQNEQPLFRLSADALWYENQTVDAQDLIAAFFEAKAINNLTHFETCGDARVRGVTLFGDAAFISHHSIAVGGEKSPFYYLYNHKSTRQIIIAGHFDGETLTEVGKRPRGCGGLDAKANLIANGNTVVERRGVLEYVHKHIVNPDVFAQTLASAEASARVTNKPILAAPVDHITGRVYPIGVFENGELINAAVDRSKWDNPEYIYRNATMPELEIGELPDRFAKLIEQNREQIAHLFTIYPNLSRTQKVQNPRAIFISTTPKSPAIRYPRTFGGLNTAFNLRLPFSMNGDGEVHCTQEIIDTVIDQAEYVFTHATSAQTVDDGNIHSFSDTRSLIVETSSMPLSHTIVEDLGKKAWFKGWVDLGNQVLVAEVNAGQTTHMEEFSFT